MNCSNCRTLNLDDANFCNNCGHSFANICSNCSGENSQGAKFSSNCGEQLLAGQNAKISESEMLVQYVLKELLTKIETARLGRKMAGERRVIAILFCEVKGSTAADATELAESIKDAELRRSFESLPDVREALAV